MAGPPGFPQPGEPEWFRLVAAQVEGENVPATLPPIQPGPEVGFRSISSMTPDAVMVMDAALRITSANDAFVELFGLPDRSTVIGQSGLRYLAESDRVRATQLVARFIEIGVWDIAELEAQHTDGTAFKVEAHCELLRHDDGRFEGMLVLVRDIRYRHHGEDPLRLIVEATSRATGSAYFGSLVEHLAGIFRVRFAMVSELTGATPATARTLALWVGNGLVEKVEYPLKGTPCAGVAQGAACYYPEGTQELFPDDEWLPEMGVDGFLGAPLTDSSGKVIGLLAVMDTAPIYRSRDVGAILAVFAARAAAELERLQIEAALAKSEDRLEAAISGSRDGLFDADIATLSVYCSPRLYEIAGYRGHEDELDLSMAGLLSHLHHGDAEDTRAILLQCIAAGRPYHHSFRWRTRTGEYRWCEARLDARCDTAGTPIRLSGFVSDVTELRREARLARETGNLALIGGWELDLVSGQLHWTAGTYQLHGVSPADYTPTVETAISFYTPESRPIITRLVERAIATGEPFDQILQIDTAGGDRLWVRALGRAEWDGSRPVRVFGAIQDVSAQQRLEQELLHSQKLEGIGRLAGGIAHDFNNLLTAILGYADLGLSALPADSRVREDLEQIRRAGVRAAELTSQLLAFARRQRISPRVVDLPTLLQEALPLLRRLAGQPVTIVIDTAAGTWPVMVDPGPLEQVLVNLVINGRDAMPDGGIITIGTSNRVGHSPPRQDGGQHAPADWVELSVTDTGGGISAEVLPLIFEPFFTTKARGKGTGLGLATCHGLIHQAGGHIWATSNGPGCGAELHCLLPRSRKTPVLEPGPAEAPGQRGHETILVLEDEAPVRALAVRVLRSVGYHVLEAANGDEARLIAASWGQKLDLIVSDVVLPDVAGPEVVRDLRDRHPGLKSLMVSGYADWALLALETLPPNTAFLPKPFNLGDLTAKVREILDAP